MTTDPGQATAPPESKTLVFVLPWWLHPLSLLMFVPGATALAAIAIPDETYREVWRTPKFLDSDTSIYLCLAILAMAIGLLVTSFNPARERRIEVAITAERLRILQKCFRITFRLTLLGYVFWVGFAIAGGVSLAQLTAVVDQQLGAISELKSGARPVAGLTTLTQLGPLAAVLGAILAKLGAGSRRYRILLVLAVVRALFYAERLAVIEVALPLILFSVFTTSYRPGWRSRVVRLLPLYAVPLLWSVFSAFEYFRSWVYFGTRTSQGFFEYMSLRLLGYYVTSYNNSALFNIKLRQMHQSQFPHLTFGFVRNTPGLDLLFDQPTYSGLSESEWTKTILTRYAAPQFNNKGSFLLSQAELGTVGMILLWALMGAVLGVVYSRACRGNLGALIGFCCIAIGIVELPRIVYWFEGRAIPTLIAAMIVARMLRPDRPTTAKGRAAGARPARGSS